PQPPGSSASNEGRESDDTMLIDSAEQDWTESALRMPGSRPAGPEWDEPLTADEDAEQADTVQAEQALFDPGQSLEPEPPEALQLEAEPLEPAPSEREQPDSDATAPEQAIVETAVIEPAMEEPSTIAQTVSQEPAL